MIITLNLLSSAKNVMTIVVIMSMIKSISNGYTCLQVAATFDNDDKR